MRGILFVPPTRLVAARDIVTQCSLNLFIRGPVSRHGGNALTLLLLCCSHHFTDIRWYVSPAKYVFSLSLAVSGHITVVVFKRWSDINTDKHET